MIKRLIAETEKIIKMIEENDPDEKIKWLNDVYGSAEDMKSNLKHLQEGFDTIKEIINDAD